MSIIELSRKEAEKKYVTKMIKEIEWLFYEKVKSLNNSQLEAEIAEMFYSYKITK